MKKLISRIVVFSLISLFSLSNAAIAAGGGGNGSGSGNGTGGGSDEALTLVSSTIPNGATGVAKDTKIKLEFSKNVTFDSVRIGNMNAFSMVDKDSKTVAIKVILADSSNEDEKDFVVIEAVNGLENANKYTITINTNLQSKSGDKFLKAQNITFSTVGYGQTSSTNTTVSNNTKTTSNTNTTVTNNTKTTSNTKAAVSNDSKTTVKEVSNPKTGDGINNNIMISLSIIILFCMYNGFQFCKKRIN